MRWIVRSIFALLLLAVLGVGALFLIPAERIARIAADQFKAATGRELTISGAVHPSIWPQLGVKTGPISIANAEWSKEGPMLKAEGLAISLDLQALIGGAFKITAVEAISPRIVLERSAKGQENWVFGDKTGANGASTAAPFTLGKGEIKDGELVFIDHKAKTRVELTAIAAETAIPSYHGPVEISLSAVMHGQAFATTMKIGAFDTFLNGQVVPVDLALQAGDAKITFDGRAGHAPLVAEGALDANLGNLAAISAIAGSAPPALPEGLGARAVSVAGNVTLTEKGALYLRGGKVNLDGNALTGDADLVTSGDRPKLSAQIRAGALNLAALSAGGSSAPASGWPKTKIDASGLGAMDAAIALTADAIDLGLTKLGASQVIVTIDRARAVFDIRKVGAYNGNIAGQFVVNARKGLSIGGDLTFAGLALEPLLKDFSDYDRLLGTADFKIKFLGSGQTVDAIMQGLQGSGSLKFSKGEIRGLDIAGMLTRLDTSFVGEGQKTIFDAISASFTMAGGVVSNEDLVLKAPYITAKGSGTVGLGARNQDYRLQATALADAAGAGGITAPLRIKGTWAKPKFSLDVESLAKENLGVEAKKLEAKAKAKLADKLGIKAAEGESLKDAAKRRGEEVLKDEAAKALEKLLGGGN